jgi:hypothetical protein
MTRMEEGLRWIHHPKARLLEEIHKHGLTFHQEG